MHEGLHDEKGVGGFDEPVGFHPDEPFIGVIPYNARLLGRKLADSWCTMMGDLFCVLFKAVHKFPESPYSRQPHEPPGYGEWFHDYARDDYVITEKDVAMAYQYLVQLHGGRVKLYLLTNDDMVVLNLPLGLCLRV